MRQLSTAIRESYSAHILKPLRQMHRLKIFNGTYRNQRNHSAVIDFPTLLLCHHIANRKCRDFGEDYLPLLKISATKVIVPTSTSVNMYGNALLNIFVKSIFPIFNILPIFYFEVITSLYHKSVHQSSRL